MSAFPFRGPAVRPAGSSPASFVPGLSVRLRHLLREALYVLATPVRFYRARAQFAQVARLTDYELADIGLTRSDVADVTALPRDVDPTTELARRVESRRRRA